MRDLVKRVPRRSIPALLVAAWIVESANPAPRAWATESTAAAGTETVEAAHRVQGVVQALAERGGATFLASGPLQRAAERIAAQAIAEPSNAMDRAALWGEGVRDVGGRSHCLLAGQIPPDAALRAVWAALPFTPGTVASVGVVRGRDQFAVALLLVPRRVEFVAPDRVRLPPEVTEGRVTLTGGDGRVQRRSLEPSAEGLLRFDDHTGSVPGTTLFELEIGPVTRPELAAAWMVVANPPAIALATPADPLGLGPLGLGAAPAAASALGDWLVGGASPDRAPTGADAAEAAEHLRQVLEARRRVAGLPWSQRVAALDRAALGRSLARLGGPSVPPLAARLSEGGLRPRAATEIVVVTPTPMDALIELLLSETGRSMAMGAGDAPLSIATAIRGTTAGWEVAVTLARAELGAAGASWNDVINAHLTAARERAGLPRLLPSSGLNALALAAAHDLVGRAQHTLDPAARSALLEAGHGAVPGSRAVAADVLVTTDPADARGLVHVTQRAYSEVGLAVLEAGPRHPGALVIVLILVQR